MKYLKTYEDIPNEPQIGDYVVCEDKIHVYSSNLGNFFKNNVGQIISRNPEEFDFEEEYRYVIKFKNIPVNLRYYFGKSKTDSSPYGLTAMKREEILYYSKSEEDAIENLSVVYDANKYNL